MERTLDILQFTLSTTINLHILTCTQIILCIHRDFSESWMGWKEVNPDDYMEQYIIALYFVTTTLSTCGFGDIYATKGDAVEAACILFLQFVGMLFYSMTIQKVQSFMISDELSPGEYANFMVEVVENLIVKVGRQLPTGRQILGETINSWKINTLKYFQASPNAFLIENEFFRMISSSMKVKIVKNNMMTEFIEKFDTLFLDPEFGFKADDKLTTKLFASLSYEYMEKEDDEDMVWTQSIISLDIVSSMVYFIFEGEIDISHKEMEQPFVTLSTGSYFGEISFIFQVRNQYKFIPKQGIPCRIFSIQEPYLLEIFDDFPDFKSLLQIRALRRQHYFKRIRDQLSKMVKVRKNKKAFTIGQGKDSVNNIFNKDLLSQKKARLIEDKIPYEDLVIQNNFSEDEGTFDLHMNNIRERNNTVGIQKVRKFEKVFHGVRDVSMRSMQGVVDTMASIDKNSKKLIY